MILEVSVAPTLDPVTLAEAKRHCRVDDDTEDDDLTRVIKVARQKAEGAAARTLLTTTYQLKLPAFPAGNRIVLPRPPVASVTSVTYYDTGNVLQTLAVTTGYLTYCGAKRGEVYLPEGGSWPSTYDRPDAVIVTYVAGWTSAALVPPCIKQWCLMAVGTMYENRELTASGSVPGELPHDFAAGLLDPERLIPIV